jgi:hypothetical protein
MARNCTDRRLHRKQITQQTAEVESAIQLINISNPCPNIAHLKVYGCYAYALKPSIPRKQELESRAHMLSSWI